MASDNIAAGSRNESDTFWNVQENPESFLSYVKLTERSMHVIS